MVAPWQAKRVNRTIDYTALFVPISADEVAQFRVERARVSGTGSPEQVKAIVTVISAVGVALMMVIVVLIPSLALIASLASGSSDLIDTVALVPGAALLTVVVVVSLRAFRQWRASAEQRLRMSRFAEANGFRFDEVSPGPTYPGAIFGLGSSRSVTDHFRTPEGRFIDFGNYTYVTGSGRSRTTHRWGFLAMHLDRALPHMLLDSRANNGMFGSTNLPAVFRKDQVLSLEGDFDRYFTLYCPKQYERDALYVFTPDLMALLIDEAAPFDVEIVDQWLFVYSAQPFPRADAATYQRLLRIVTTVGAKALSQTDRYVDERIGVFEANIVAPSGQRLRRGVSWVGVAIIGLFMAIWVTSIVSSFLN